MSLEVAIGGTLIAMLIGTRARDDRRLSRRPRRLEHLAPDRVRDGVPAAAARDRDRLAVVEPARPDHARLLTRGVFSLIVLIGAFTWFYPARIIRTQVAELRSREFIDAAVMIGANDSHILRTHVVPHVLPTAIVYTTLLIPVNILLEAGITFLGVGIKLPTPSWGNLLSAVWGSVLNPTVTSSPLRSQVWLTLLPSLMIFITVFTFNQLGEGLREAFDAEARE